MVRYVQQNDPDPYHFIPFINDCTFIIRAIIRGYQGKLASEAVAGTVRKEDYNDTSSIKKKKVLNINMLRTLLCRRLSVCRYKNNSAKGAPLKYLYHLIQPFTGVLKSGVGPIHALTQLHPTPAVAGTPIKKPSCIAYETFSRNGMLAQLGF